MSNKPLTKRQKAVLAQLAVRAYKQLQAYGCPLPSLRDWRHDEVWAATGITESLTKATQEHYVPIYNRLASYLGCAPVKDRTWSEMDKAIHNLRDSMQRYEITPDYLAEIVRDQLHLPCTGRDVYQALRNKAAVEHVRHLMYTVINRGRAEARKMAAETGQETYEPHADPCTMPPGKLADHVGAVRIVPTPGPHKTTERGFHSNIWMPDQEVQP
ncbi:hypothetical protein [Akkermansia muciniphila]|uniref:hypothetical protein n=1 Tax=Akkermansia muciniphila TaxID=239935 RepID=UPI001C0629AE|nr:hypothetical protein [Akkermansia muciniphila]QWP05025.1 hypothetical protein J5W77_10315 [Akkermansia muciniphila]QWP24805.1 hypothetical protein J5W81_02535 [Akkermansia muciniphila]QWP28819.1 hypothetical protein J5W80_10350 [Akkermansia muciniphila]